LTLRVVVSFSVSPDGITSQPRIEKSSGYNDVDAAVVEAVRRWKFSADPGAAPIRGRRDYEFRVR
jgi:TonB family protein